MTLSKTVIGLISPQMQSSEEYENIVKKYTMIIDAEADGGRELHQNQQMDDSEKWLWLTVIIGATLGNIMSIISPHG